MRSLVQSCSRFKGTVYMYAVVSPLGPPTFTFKSPPPIFSVLTSNCPLSGSVMIPSSIPGPTTLTKLAGDTFGENGLPGCQRTIRVYG